MNTTMNTTMNSSTARSAGLGLIAYGIGTTAGFLGVAAPGGEYDAEGLASYLSPDHQWTAFAFGYLGAICALGLLVFGAAARRLWPRVGDTLWGLSIAATAVSLVGGFVISGVLVSMAEGGSPVRGGVPDPVVYVFGEVGNLLALCAPAFFMGVAALVLVARAGLPRWLRIWGALAGVSGLLLAFYFVIPVYLLWVVAFGAWLSLRGTRAGSRAAAPAVSESLV